MANISTYLAAILNAVYGEEVRGSIHDAIEIINDVSEKVLTPGTAVTSTTSSSSGFFEDSLYLNTDTWDLWKCIGTDSWQKLGNIKGATGKGIVSIEKTATSGLVDTYTITYTEGSPTTFAVVNGKGIVSIQKKSTSGLTDTYEIAFNDGPSTTFTVHNGDGVTGVSLISTVGRVKTYEMTFDERAPFQFVIEDGAAGPGSGDMLASVYDPNGDNIVDELKTVDDIDDVDTSTNPPADHEVFEYDDTDGKWENKLPEQTYDPTSERVISGAGVADAFDILLEQIQKGSLPITSYLVTDTGDRIVTDAGDHITVRQIAKFTFA